jgi:hypothetical protein
MEDNVLRLIVNAARPFKEFEVEAGDERQKFYTRRPSAAETSHMQRIYAEEVAKAKDELETLGGDMDALRHNFGKQPQEKLAKFVVEADRIDYLNEAASELDDAKLDDPKVVELAETRMEEARKLLEKANFEEVLDAAIDRRAFVLTASRASQIQSRYLLHYMLYKEVDGEKVKAFPIEFIEQELDNDTINFFLTAALDALGDKEDNPLKLVPPKSSRRRTQSRSTSAEE